ncbi:MAG: type II toxin-antitoxin system VapC family toxin [Acidobacteriaceae bacterium]|jgi:PIN domain nuclease of toxin-antitoxin system
MTDAVVLDASAILAFLLEEPGAEAVLTLLEDGNRIALIGSVNLCEVSTKLVALGGDSSHVSLNTAPLLPYVVDFDAQQALYAGELARITKPFGLSLGDRACLALAASRGATAWTTDAAWLKLKIGVKVHLLRG